MKLIAKWYTAFRLWVVERMFYWVIMKRKPDLTIGPVHDATLQRWHLIPRNPFCAIALQLVGKTDRRVDPCPWLFSAIWHLDGGVSEFVEWPQYPDKIGTGYNDVYRHNEGAVSFRFMPRHRFFELYSYRPECNDEDHEVTALMLVIAGPVRHGWHCRLFGCRHAEVRQ